MRVTFRRLTWVLALPLFAMTLLPGRALANTPPTLVHPPMLFGIPQVGQTLTATPGDWSGVPTPQVTSFTWWDCDASGANCQPNPEGPGLNSTFTLTAADIGHRIEATVYVDNGSTASATTCLTAVVRAASPSAHSLRLQRRGACDRQR